MRVQCLLDTLPWLMAATAMVLPPGAMPGVPLLCNLFSGHLPLRSVQRQQTVTGTVFCQIYEHGRGLAFHFDKDEHRLKEEGTMVHPIVNSIIYLTGDSAKSRLGA